MKNLILISNLLQKDFYIIITNFKPRSNIINVNNSCKRKIFLMNILIILVINVFLSFIIYNT